MSTKNNKVSKIVYSLVIVLGIVLACTNIIPNEYAKLLVVFVALGFGLHGLLKGLKATPSEDDGKAVSE